MIKRIALGLGIVIALLAVALILVTLLFNPNDYKDKISDLAREATGRELTIVDDMKLSLFPWIGVEFGRVEFANAAGFGPQPFARIAAAKVKVKLLPLLQRRVEVATVVLTGLEVSLATAADGHNNWEDLGAHAAPQGAPPKTAPAGGQTALALPAALTIGGLDLRDGTLHWRDDAGGTRLDITGLHLISGSIESGKPVDLKFGFDLHGTKPALDGRLELTTRLTADLAQQRLQAEGLKLDTTLTGPGLPLQAQKIELGLQADVTADLAAKTYRADRMRLATTLTGADLPGGRLALELQGDAAADLARQTLDLPRLSLTTQGLTLQGKLAATNLLEAPQAKGHLQAAAFNPRELLQALGKPAPVTADAKALTRAAFAFDFEAARDRAAVSALKLELDDSALTGTASVRGFAAPALAFDLALDQIDLDHYLPPPTGAPVAATPAAAAPAAAQLPLETLRKLDLDGRLKAGRLIVSGLKLTDIKLEAHAKDGLIALAPLDADLYGGRYAGNIRLDARGAEPAFSFDESLSGIQAEPLLKDLLDNDTFSGTADFALKATTHGAAEQALLRNLQGQARFGLRNGAVKGFNVAQMIRQAKAKLSGQPAPAAAANQTDFTEMGGTLRFDGGIARNDDLHASSPYLRIGGDGQADLVRQQLDYRLRVKLVGTEVGQGAEQLADVKGVEIPLRISGAFTAPSIALDSDIIRDVLGKKAKDALKKALDPEKDKAKEKLEGKKQSAEEKLKNKLKNLLQ